MSLYKLIKSLQTYIHANIKLIIAYLAKISALTKLVNVINQIHDTYSTHVKQTNTKQVIR